MGRVKKKEWVVFLIGKYGHKMNQEAHISKPSKHQTNADN